ncbi:MAG: SDR family NAD(P)-dependent oxidoreductase [Actinomycetota bacterium]|nr:SDR family NAD(P)-dependent oxidoreductase [Actinomycetota bacterium]
MQIRELAAVVTGAASGLGGATARALAAAGASVFGLDLADSIEKSEPVERVTLVEADVTDEDQVRAAVEQAAAAAPLRLVVNCAGIATAGRILSKAGPHDLALFRSVIDVNLVGTFNVLRLGAEAMARTAALEEGQRGVIINTASIAAFDGQVGQVAYAASKGGVVALTLSAARDLASYGIRVCTIAPGIIDTPMLAGVNDEFRATLAAGVPFPRRLGLPDEYAKLALMVIDHDYLNGEVIRMDGSLRMAPR